MSELQTHALLKKVCRKYSGIGDEEALESHIKRVQEKCDAEGITFLEFTPRLSPLLAEIPVPPLGLFVRGNLSLLNLHAIAVVGTRKPSRYGIQASLGFSSALAKRGLVVVSGLAYGIDAAAHRGALQAGGFTIAVLGHGLDRVYPSAHRPLTEAILEKGGCLISEYPPFVMPLPHHFPQRNRIIAGLSRGVLVVEAALKSGSLITAEMALHSNREVFVVPGPFSDSGYRGGHSLIQQGAKLVTSVEDLLVEFPWLQKPLEDESGKITEEILWLKNAFEKLGGSGSASELIEVSGKKPAEVERSLSISHSLGLSLQLYPQQYAWIETARYNELGSLLAKH